MPSGVEGLPLLLLFDNPALSRCRASWQGTGDGRIFGLAYNDDLRRFWSAYGWLLKMFTLAVSYSFEFTSKSEAN